MSHPVFIQATDKIFVNMNYVKVVRYNEEGNTIALEVEGAQFHVEQPYQSKFASVLDALVKPDRGNSKAKLD